MAGNHHFLPGLAQPNYAELPPSHNMANSQQDTSDRPLHPPAMHHLETPPHPLHPPPKLPALPGQTTTQVDADLSGIPPPLPPNQQQIASLLSQLREAGYNLPLPPGMPPFPPLPPQQQAQATSAPRGGAYPGSFVPPKGRMSARISSSDREEGELSETEGLRELHSNKSRPHGDPRVSSHANTESAGPYDMNLFTSRHVTSTVSSQANSFQQSFANAQAFWTVQSGPDHPQKNPSLTTLSNQNQLQPSTHASPSAAAPLKPNSQTDKLIERIVSDIGFTTAQERSQHSLSDQRDGLKKFISLLYFFGYMFNDLMAEVYQNRPLDCSRLAELYRELNLPVPSLEPPITEAASTSSEPRMEIAKEKSIFSESHSDRAIQSAKMAAETGIAKPASETTMTESAEHKAQFGATKQQKPQDRAAYLAQLRQVKKKVTAKVPTSKSTPTPPIASQTPHAEPQHSADMPPPISTESSNSASSMQTPAQFQPVNPTTKNGSTVNTASVEKSITSVATPATPTGSSAASSVDKEARKRELNNLARQRLAKLRDKNMGAVSDAQSSYSVDMPGLLSNTPNALPDSTDTRSSTANAITRPPTLEMLAPASSSTEGLSGHITAPNTSNEAPAATTARSEMSLVQQPSTTDVLTQATLPNPRGRKRPVASDFDNSAANSPRPHKRLIFGSDPYTPEKMIIDISDDESEGEMGAIDEQAIDELISEAAQASRSSNIVTSSQRQSSLRNMGPLKDFSSRANGSAQLSLGSSAISTPGPGTPSNSSRLSAIDAQIAETKAKIRAKEAMQRLRKDASRAQSPAKNASSHQAVTPGSHEQKVMTKMRDSPVTPAQKSVPDLPDPHASDWQKTEYDDEAQLDTTPPTPDEGGEGNLGERPDVDQQLRSTTSHSVILSPSIEVEPTTVSSLPQGIDDPHQRFNSTQEDNIPSIVRPVQPEIPTPIADAPTASNTEARLSVSADEQDGEDDDDEDLYSAESLNAEEAEVDQDKLVPPTDDDFNMSDDEDAMSVASENVDVEKPSDTHQMAQALDEDQSSSHLLPGFSMVDTDTSVDHQSTPVEQPAHPKDTFMSEASASAEDEEEGEIVDVDDDDELYEPHLPPGEGIFPTLPIRAASTENEEVHVLETYSSASNPVTPQENVDDIEMVQNQITQGSIMDNSPGALSRYESPLKMFKAFRFHPDFPQEVPGGFKSLTYSHKIDPDRRWCATEANGDVCNDSGCQSQHFRDMALDDSTLLLQLGSTPKHFEDAQKKAWASQLRSLLTQLRESGMTDVTQVAFALVQFRRKFLGDPTKILDI